MGYNLTENLFGYTLVQDILVESATTSVTFSGLNYTAADDLLLVSSMNNSSSNGRYNLFVNGNTTQTNYYSQYLYSDSSTVGSERNNYPMFNDVVSNQHSLSFSKIKMTNNGYFVYQSEFERQIGTSFLFMGNNNGTSTFTISSITSLTLSAQSTQNINIGSRFRLYKLNATKVADITVGTATTSVDITGLNITKDSEYMLVSDVVNPISNITAYRMFVNANNTPTNYYSQFIYADNISVASNRYNAPEFSYVDSLSKVFSISQIKLTNNGNFISQNSDIPRYGNSNPMLINYNLTSTFTTTSITQLQILATSTNGIGVGSRFQLYRMKG